MFEIRPNRAHCNKDLPNTSADAMICSFECTYCKNYVVETFKNVWPTCAGDFIERPIRPAKMIEKHQASQIRVFKPKDLERTRIKSEKYKQIHPTKR